MPAKEKACKYCKAKKPIETMVQINLAWYCDWNHGVEHGKELAAKSRERATRKADKRIERKRIDAKAANRLRKKEIMTRREWYDKLQVLVNQYVVHVRDKDKGCCTCGKTDPSVKYDAGHLYTRASRPDIRFELTNIHKQCSVNCNQHGSGMRVEYEAFIVKTYGITHLEWLQERKPNLKVQFKHWSDIENEIIIYRALLRSFGVKPNV